MAMLASTAFMQTEPAPRASDGHTLAEQSADTQASFIAVWGDQAAARWATEHSAELARTAAQIPPTSAATSTPIPPPPTLTPLPAQASATALPTEATATAAHSPTATLFMTAFPTPTLFGGAGGIATSTSPPTAVTSPTRPGATALPTSASTALPVPTVRY